MSITAETVKQHVNDPAVLCCRAEEGTALEPANFEDPAIFPDLVDSGLLNTDGALPLGAIKMGETKLTKTVDSLTPITPDIVDTYDESFGAGAEEAQQDEVAEEAAPAPLAAAPAAGGGIFKLHIGEGKDINIEIPTGALAAGGAAVANVVESGAGVAEAPSPVAEAGKEEVLRTLTRRHFKIEKVERGPETKIEGTTLYIREGIEEEVVETEEIVHKVEIEIITPDKYHTFSNTVMDVQPIAVKESDEDVLGEGVTRVLDGVVMVVTGVTEEGVQIGEFGSSEGYLDENMMWGRPGAVDKGEIMIKTNATIENKRNMERPGPIAVHKVTDHITEEIRQAMKKIDESEKVEDQELKDIRRPGKPKVVVVKEIMGQGAMHDNFLFPDQPVGTFGARPNVDLGNVPVCANALEVLDGCIHALTCIGPASKEMSRHYWREPLVLECLHDEEIDLVGVVFIGSPQANGDKFYVSRRLGQTIENMNVDGAFVTTEGFGNNHVDFVSNIEQIGKRGVPVVGFSFCAVQGALVVGNKYCDAMIDCNKSMSGIENEVLECNSLCTEDAIRGLAMLKAKMAGEEIKAPERHYNVNVKNNNVELIEKATGEKIDLVDNEQSLPMSEKRKEKYD